MATLHPKSCLHVSSIQSFLPTSNTFDQVMFKHLVTPVDITLQSTTATISELILKPASFELPKNEALPAPKNDFLFGIPKIYSEEQKTIVLIDYNEQKLRYTEAQFTILDDLYENLLSQLSTYTKGDEAVKEHLSTLHVSTDYKGFTSERKDYKEKYIKSIHEIIAKGIFSKKVLEGSSSNV